MPTNQSKFEVYQDKRGEYRWRLRAGNGRIIAVSSEGYKERRDCITSVHWVRNRSHTTPLYELCPSIPQPSQQGHLT